VVLAPVQRRLRRLEVVHLQLGTDVLEDVAQHRARGCLVIDDDDVQGRPPVPVAVAPPSLRGPAAMVAAASAGGKSPLPRRPSGVRPPAPASLPFPPCLSGLFRA